jgi:predicted Zn-dependent protease
MRVILAVIMVIVSLLSYYSRSVFNPITGRSQHIDLTVQQETALGLRAVPQMEQQNGGECRDPRKRAIVDAVGRRIIERSAAGQTPYHFDFHLLENPQVVNAFALPGGQVFMTTGLLDKLDTEGEIAGVLGHEIGHVCARHGAEQLAKQRLTQGMAGAAVIATSDPNNRNSGRNAAIAMAVAQLVTLKFSRDDELQADQLGVRFMSEAGYDPRSMIKVMEILEKVGGGGGAEFFQTHPNSPHRIKQIEEAIQRTFPEGVPPGLQQ